MSVFSNFSPRLQEAIVARLGWTSLRPVQEQAGEALLAGSNAVIANGTSQQNRTLENIERETELTRRTRQTNDVRVA